MQGGTRFRRERFGCSCRSKPMNTLVRFRSCGAPVLIVWSHGACPNSKAGVSLVLLALASLHIFDISTPEHVYRGWNATFLLAHNFLAVPPDPYVFPSARSHIPPPHRCHASCTHRFQVRPESRRRLLAELCIFSFVLVSVGFWAGR